MAPLADLKSIPPLSWNRPRYILCLHSFERTNMPSFLRVVALLSAFSGCFSAYVGKRSTQVKDIYDFPNGTSLESLAVRANGREILTTVITSAELYLIDLEHNSKATLLHSFPGYSSLLGITEILQDQFYVVAGNFSFDGDVSVTGSYSVFHVDMALYPIPPSVSKVADFPDGQLLNGLGVLSKERGLVYVADSYAGVIRLLDVYTGENSVAINVALTQAPSGGGLGANGVHVSPDSQYVYFTNTGLQILARIRIDSNGSPIGEAEVVASDIAADDFTFDKDGNVIQALNGFNEVAKIDVKSGNVVVLAGSTDSTELEEPTMVRFGREESDKNSVYVSLNGGLGRSTQEGGSVKRIDFA
ncbi:hypothetical protein GYMLUDRAFT_215098 [Collybiopsis luxurians FD-317 M1]|nr:hypothetical protein GYMLUDRAFT_215098 [Collybiopsis luxurians FD-317 M1]